MKLKILFLIALGSFLLCGMFDIPHNAQASSKPALSLARQGQRPPNDTITPPPPPSPDPGHSVMLQCAKVSYDPCLVKCIMCEARYQAIGTDGTCISYSGTCTCGGKFFKNVKI